MCGRAACGLDPDAICNGCGFRGRDGRRVQPRWRDPPGGQKYQPSYNMAPGTHMPVLMSKKHLEDETKNEPKKEEPSTKTEPMETDDECEFIVQPMRWGLIPSWHKGEMKNVGYNMINTRSEGMLSKATFSRPLLKGRRCVILVEGYFEWHNKDGKKQPHFIYFPKSTITKEEGVKKLQEVKSEYPDDGGAEQKQLLTLAGLFDRWWPKNGDPPVYSHSIITVEADKSMSWLHERMPAVLTGEDEVRAWLDFGEVPLEKAVKLIRPVSNVTSHPVSTTVNRWQEKGEECIKPIDLEKVKESASSKLMASWLGGGKKKALKRSSPPPDEDKVKVKSEIAAAADSEVPDEVKVKSEVEGEDGEEEEEAEAPSPKKAKLEYWE